MILDKIYVNKHATTILSDNLKSNYNFRKNSNIFSQRFLYTNTLSNHVFIENGVDFCYYKSVFILYIYIAYY